MRGVLRVGTTRLWMGIAASMLLGLSAVSVVGCATGSAGSPAGTATETAGTAQTAPTAFDAQAIADLDSDEFAAAIATLTPEQLAEVQAIVEAEVAAEAEPVVVAPVKKVYKKLSSRGFKQMAKDADSYAGKSYVLYGEITQFDSATGTDTFRADLGYKKLKKSYGYVNYPQNSILTGSEEQLKKFVQGDLITVKVTVLGSYSYDTQIGGSTTVPSFQVDSISRYGSVD